MASERVQRQIDRLLDQAEEAMGQMAWEAAYIQTHYIIRS